MARSTNPLHEVLQDPVTSQAQREIIAKLWPDPQISSTPSNHLDWTAYFDYYSKQCTAALIEEGIYLAARTHHDLVKIARLLEKESSRDGVRQKLRQDLTQQRSPADENRMLDGSMKLAARLFAMINIGSFQSEVSGRLSLPWTQGSLRDAIHSYFKTPPEIDTDPKLHIIGTDLACRNIDRISGIGIVLTDNLLDHLRLVEKDKKLCIFHHVSFLKKMKAIDSPLFPDGLIEETLETLALLLPETDRKTKRWLENEFGLNSAQPQMDRGLLRCGHIRAGHPSRRLERFYFWRDRLGALREAVEEATPPSKALLKALRDRKKGDRWLNSWVAIVAIGLTLFFGLVQSIEGAMQVYKAYHS